MEHVSTGTLIIILVIMIVVSAYFSASETGMMTLNRYRLRHLSKQGNRSARRVEKLLQKPDRLIGLEDESLKGQGVGKKLVALVVEKMRAEQRKIIPLCPFAKHEFDTTPAYQDIRA